MGVLLNLWPRNMGRYQLRNFSKVSKPPRRPYEKERLDSELKLIGQFGLKNKREIWRVRLALAKIRATARTLLTKDDKDPVRIFEGQALLRRMIRYESSTRTSSVWIMCSLLRLSSSWSAVSRPSCSSVVLPSPSIMLVCSSVSATSVLAARSSTCPPSWCVLSRSPTLSSP